MVSPFVEVKQYFGDFCFRKSNLFVQLGNVNVDEEIRVFAFTIFDRRIVHSLSQQ